MVIVNLDQLESSFEAGELINAKKLIAKNLIKTAKTGVKILGDGKLTKKFTVSADSFSESAKKAIIEAGGQVQLASQDKK
jgi:large subunit ribosomal protein L15